MSDNAWNDYAREAFEAREDQPYRTRRIAGSLFDENDVPDEEDVL